MEVWEKKVFEKKVWKRFGGQDKMCQVWMGFGKGWEKINESCLKDLR